MKIHGLMHNTTTALLLLMIAFMVAYSFAQDTTTLPTDFYPTFCLAQAQLNNCYTPSFITSCGDNMVECKDSGSSIACPNDTVGISVECAPVDADAAEALLTSGAGAHGVGSGGTSSIAILQGGVMMVFLSLLLDIAF
jgi:hypothetical protein